MVDTVREVMTPSPLTVTRQATVEDAAQRMREHGVGDVLVASGARLRGILTDRDIIVRAIAMGHNPVVTLADECCSTDVLTVNADDTTERATELMRQHALRRLPVIDGGQLVGIVSICDLAVAEDPKSPLADISSAPPNV